jgi:hypothetical protein
VAAVKLRAADDERRQAKRNSLADKLATEAKALADGMRVGCRRVRKNRALLETVARPADWRTIPTWVRVD